MTGVFYLRQKMLVYYGSGIYQSGPIAQMDNAIPN